MTTSLFSSFYLFALGRARHSHPLIWKRGRDNSSQVCEEYEKPVRCHRMYENFHVFASSDSRFQCVLFTSFNQKDVLNSSVGCYIEYISCYGDLFGPFVYGISDYMLQHRLSLKYFSGIINTLIYYTVCEIVITMLYRDNVY